MRTILFLPLFIFLLYSCRKEKSGSLEDAFILSLKENNFDVLKTYLPDMEFYKSLGSKMPRQNDEGIKKFLEDNNQKLKEAWQNTIFNVASKKIDMSNVRIKEVFFYDPFPQDETSEAMVINYEYNGKTWDDLQFIVGRRAGRVYLLVIPHATRAFSMADPELRASNEARAWIEMQKPEFNKKLGKLTDNVIKAVKENNAGVFSQMILYRGADESRKWKTAVNMKDSLEREQANEFMQKVAKAVASCTEQEAGTYRTERESEGLWIILPVRCGNRFIQFTYLWVNSQYLLGDVSVIEV